MQENELLHSWIAHRCAELGWMPCTVKVLQAASLAACWYATRSCLWRLTCPSPLLLHAPDVLVKGLIVLPAQTQRRSIAMQCHQLLHTGCFRGRHEPPRNSHPSAEGSHCSMFSKQLNGLAGQVMQHL